MARKLDTKAIEANRQKRHKGNDERERRVQEFRDAVKENNVNPRTYEVPPEVRVKIEPAKKPITAGYARVSTQEEAQAESFENQVQHLTKMIQSNPSWEFGGIFSDEGISGTTVAGRKGFQRMIEAAQNHEIDLIVTKVMSRFGRNSREILANLEILASLKPPVGVIFELPGLHSLDPKNDLLITILSAIAQLEAQQKSESIKRGIRSRMKLGIFKFTVRNTLGYYRDFYGRIKVDEAEAEIVKFIYESFLEGAAPVDIADALTRQEISTPTGLYVWRPGTILGILSNEKYTGNALFQKYIVKNYLDQKTVKNNIIPMIMAENNHQAIISQHDWDKVQELLRTRKTQEAGRSTVAAMRLGNSFNFTRIKSGALKGHYLLDCNWTRIQRKYFLQNIVSPIMIKELSTHEHAEIRHFKTESPGY